MVPVKLSFDEIQVYAGIAERTGLRLERNTVRRSAACCGSLTDLMRKARLAGDGTFYLPVALWPVGQDRLDVMKRWVVI